jgi:signal transduction histidine kinase
MNRTRPIGQPGAIDASEPVPCEEGARVQHSGLAAIAHDLRNPLGVIAFSAARLMKESAPDPGTIRQTLEVILRSVHGAERLIEDLLDAGAEARRPFAVHPAWVPAADLLLEGKMVGEPLALSSSLTLVVESALDLPLVWADTERIAQAFANLIGNAAKFTSAGGSIKVRARAVARDVHFSVADTGPGVKEEDRTRVFAPFWQVDPGDRRGRGLGLWICRQIVEAHGGRIWIDSGPDGGAVFVFALRRSEGKPTGQDDVTHRPSPIRLTEEIEWARRSTTMGY